MDWTGILKVVESTITGVGLQVLGAIVLYIVGRWLISFAVGLVQKGLIQQKLEPTLLRFLLHGIHWDIMGIPGKQCETPNRRGI